MWNKQFSNLFSLTENPIFKTLLESVRVPTAQPLPDIVREVHINSGGEIDYTQEPNIELVFDPYTGKLKDANIFIDEIDDAQPE